MEEKRITITQVGGNPPDIVLEGDWKAKEVVRLPRLLTIAYRRKMGAIRREQAEQRKQEDKEE